MYLCSIIRRKYNVNEETHERAGLASETTFNVITEYLEEAETLVKHWSKQLPKHYEYALNTWVNLNKNYRTSKQRINDGTGRTIYYWSK